MEKNTNTDCISHTKQPGRLRYGSAELQHKELQGTRAARRCSYYSTLLLLVGTWLISTRRFFCLETWAPIELIRIISYLQRLERIFW